jgi:O-antigen/teichoic acid export membrane protein
MLMSQSAKIARNSAFLMLAKGVNTVFVLIYMPFLARYLGKENFGHYSFTYSFVGMFQVIAWLGIHRILVREVARSPDQARRYYGNALSIKLLLSLLAATVLVAAVYMRHDLNSLTRQIIFIAGAETLIRTYGTVNASLFRAFEQMHIEPILTLIDLGTSTVGVFIAIIFDLGLVGVMIAFLCGATVYMVVGLLLVSRVIGKPALQGQISIWRFLVKESLPIGGSVGIQNLYARQGTVYLRSFRDIGQVGIYGGGLRIYGLITIISAAIVSALFPTLSRRALGARETLVAAIETNLKLLTLISGGIAMLLFLMSGVIVPLLLGQELSEVTLVIQLLCPAIVFAFAATLFNDLLESTNLQQLNTIAWIIVLALNLILNITLTPRMGYIGTTLAFLVTEILFALITFYFVWKRVGRLALFSAVIKPLVPAFFSWTLGWILLPKLGLGSLLVALLLYGLLTWKLQIFTREEIGMLQRISSHLLLSRMRL